MATAENEESLVYLQETLGNYDSPAFEVSSSTADKSCNKCVGPWEILASITKEKHAQGKRASIKRPATDIFHFIVMAVLFCC